MIVPIVEGFSEVDAVPTLLRRLLYAEGVYDVEIAKPFRVKRSKVVRPNEIERAVKLAVSDREGARALIVILDSDDDCPHQLGPELLARAEAVTDVPVAVVLAAREYECWLLGAKQSLCGTRGIRDDATAPLDPEQIRDGKGHLTENMTEGRGYVEVEDQAALSAVVDLADVEANCPSFAKLCRDVKRLLATM